MTINLVFYFAPIGYEETASEPEGPKINIEEEKILLSLDDRKMHQTFRNPAH